MKIKYVDYKLPSSSKEFAPWNTMTFYGCKVLNITTVEYKAGRRMTIEIEAPKLRKKTISMPGLMPVLAKLLKSQDLRWEIMSPATQSFLIIRIRMEGTVKPTK